MTEDCVDRVLRASSEDRSRVAPVTTVRFDPLFPVQETHTTPVKYDPMGEHTFKPATGDGK